MHAFEAGKAHARGYGRSLHSYPRPLVPPPLIYARAQEIDPWPGSELVAPFYEGSSCLAAAKALQERGLITGYDWEFEDIEVCERAVFFGPLIFGIDWWSGMMLNGPPRDRWEDAVITPTGRNIGGHAIAAVGFDKNRKDAEWELQQSWGPSWGFHGRCYISKNYMNVLLHADGEALMLKDAEDDVILERLEAA
jgi:papain like protease